MEEGIANASQGGGGGGSDMPQHDRNNAGQFLGVVAVGSQSDELVWRDLRTAFGSAATPGDVFAIGSDGSINWSGLPVKCNIGYENYDTGETDYYVDSVVIPEITENGTYTLMAEAYADAESGGTFSFNVYWNSSY